MCGRFLLDSDIENILKQYKILNREVDDYKKGDFYPSQNAPMVLEGKGRTLKFAKWGFPISGNKGLVINARSESIADKPMFKDSFYTSRCVIPANLFYEWKDEENNKKTKHEIFLKDENFISLGGIFKLTFNDMGNKELSFVIITTDANSDMEAVHLRMPLIIKEDAIDYWLNKETPIKTIENIISSNLEVKLQIEKKHNESFEQLKMF